MKVKISTVLALAVVLFFMVTNALAVPNFPLVGFSLGIGHLFVNAPINYANFPIARVNLVRISEFIDLCVDIHYWNRVYVHPRYQLRKHTFIEGEVDHSDLAIKTNAKCYIVHTRFSPYFGLGLAVHNYFKFCTEYSGKRSTTTEATELAFHGFTGVEFDARDNIYLYLEAAYDRTTLTQCVIYGGVGYRFK
jgi:hypothetical protein